MNLRGCNLPYQEKKNTFLLPVRSTHKNRPMEIKESEGCTVAFWGSIKNAFVSIIPRSKKLQRGRQRSDPADAEGGQAATVRPLNDELGGYCIPMNGAAENGVNVPATNVLEPPVRMDDYYPGMIQDPGKGDPYYPEQPKQFQETVDKKLESGIIPPPPSVKENANDPEHMAKNIGTTSASILTEKLGFAEELAPVKMKNCDGTNEKSEALGGTKTQGLSDANEDGEGRRDYNEQSSLPPASPPCPSTPPPLPQSCTSYSYIQDMQRQQQPQPQQQQQIVSHISANPSPLVKSQLDLSLPCAELE